MKLFASLVAPLHPRKQRPQGFAAKQHQTLLLEPILTPSGIVDYGEDGPDVTTLPLSGDETDLGGLTDPIEDTGVVDKPESLDTYVDDTDLEDVAFITTLDSSVVDFQFESGFFTVGDNGEVTIDYLFDGGSYQGELAIFSLEGMGNLPGDEWFIQEAASRALSNSELGHVVVSDLTEGARFSGTINEPDFNQGDYQGARTVTMRPGDQFGFMLVPHGEVQDVFDDPSIEGAKRPLFSLATANPDDMLAAGQIADVFGDGNTFVFEDLRTDGYSDRDYNDIVFQVRGATGTAPLMDGLVDPDMDWRGSGLGPGAVCYSPAAGESRSPGD